MKKILIIVLLLLSTAKTSVAQTEGLVRFRAKIAHTSKAITGQSNQITFQIKSQNWSETHDVNVDENGFIEVDLGSIRPLTPQILSEDRPTLSISVDGDETEVPINYVPLAIRARYADKFAVTPNITDLAGVLNLEQIPTEVVRSEQLSSVNANSVKIDWNNIKNTPTFLEAANTFTRTQLKTPGESEVSWLNIINTPNFMVSGNAYTKEQLKTGGQSDVHFSNVKNLPAQVESLVSLLTFGTFSDGDRLSYDAASNTWITATDATTTNATHIHGVTVNSTGATDGKVLKFQSNEWILADDQLGTDTTYSAGPGLNLDAINNIFSVADNGITTNAIADKSVTFTKLQDGTLNSQEMLVWVGTQWQIIPTASLFSPFGDLAVNDLVKTPLIATQAVTAEKIADDAVTTAKIANGTFAQKEMLLWDGSNWASVATDNLFGNIAYVDQVDTDQIANGAVTVNKLADGTAAQKELLFWNGSNWASVATGNLFGNLAYMDQVDTDQIADKAVTVNKLADGTNAQKELLLWDGSNWASVATGNLFGNLAYLDQVDTDQIADKAVTVNKIADGTNAQKELLFWNGSSWASVATGNLFGNLAYLDQVDTDQIVDKAVTVNKLADGTNAQKELLFWNGSNWASVATGNLFGNLAYLDQVDTDQIVDKAVTVNKIADGTAAQKELLFWNGSNWASEATGNLFGSLAYMDQVDTDQIADKAVTVNKIADGTAAQKELLFWNGSNWASEATGNLFGSLAYMDQVDTDQIADKAVTVNKIADGTAAQKELLFWNGSNWASEATGNLFGSLAYMDQVDTDQIVDKAVTVNKIADGTAAQKELLFWNGSNWASEATGNLFGSLAYMDQIDTDQIADKAVTVNKIADGTAAQKELLFWNGSNWASEATGNLFGSLAYMDQVDTDQIADKAVTVNKIADGTAAQKRAVILEWK